MAPGELVCTVAHLTGQKQLTSVVSHLPVLDLVWGILIYALSLLQVSAA